MFMHCLNCLISLFLFGFSLNSSSDQDLSTQMSGDIKSNHSLINQVQIYISENWDILTRTHKNILEIVTDPKVQIQTHQKPVLYIPTTFSPDDTKRILQTELNYKELDQIEIRKLPVDFEKIEQHGLLYLPHSYVVPGGRFNEMYGWDSYFILIGLINDNKIDLAKKMVENFKFEIDYYGKILNANRSYYLSRSQPPLFSQMIFAVYQKTQDKHWLEGMLPSILKYYQYWTEEPRLVPSTGLSRYYPNGKGPAYEVINSTSLLESRYYHQAKDYFKFNSKNIGNINRFYNIEKDELTEEFYKSDRAIRESGLDLTSQYGPFGMYIIDHLSVALNSLLYQMENDTAQIYNIIGNKLSALEWDNKALTRKKNMNQYFWDEISGFYFDYNILTKQRTEFKSLTTYYPLWAGIANDAQAKKLHQNLIFFDEKGGLKSSTEVSGHQWDAPYGWAPFHYFVVKGLRKYGYQNEANVIAQKFINLININFEKHKTIFEKYNVLELSVDSENTTQYGYNENVTGFGWTNGVYSEFMKDLSHDTSLFEVAGNLH